MKKSPFRIPLVLSPCLFFLTSAAQAALCTVDFSQPAITTTGDAVVTSNRFYYETGMGGCHKFLYLGASYFTVSFYLPNVTDLSLAVRHASSAATGAPGGGYSPVDIVVNADPFGETGLLADNYDPASNHDATHGWCDDTFNISSVMLHSGVNTLSFGLQSDPQAYTAYWIQSLSLGNPLEYTVCEWLGGDVAAPTDWNRAANWSSQTAVPSGPGAKVRFGNQSAANNVVDLSSAGQTVGSLEFAAATRTTIESSGGFALTLDNGGGTSTINVAGSHVISAPLILNDDVIVSGDGVLDCSGGISGPHALRVTGGTLSASSIIVDSLIIGSSTASAVPEPSAFLLLALGAAAPIYFRFRHRLRTAVDG